MKSFPKEAGGCLSPENPVQKANWVERETSVRAGVNSPQGAQFSSVTFKAAVQSCDKNSPVVSPPAPASSFLSHSFRAVINQHREACITQTHTCRGIKVHTAQLTDITAVEAGIQHPYSTALSHIKTEKLHWLSASEPRSLSLVQSLSASLSRSAPAAVSRAAWGRPAR